MPTPDRKLHDFFFNTVQGTPITHELYQRLLTERLIDSCPAEEKLSE
jgi:hypothetical protein